MRRAALILFVLGLPACAALASADDWPEGGGGTMGAGATGATGQPTGGGDGGAGAIGGDRCSGEASAENCGNGCDDDGDTDIDCADTDCACLPSPPLDWSGPVILDPAGSCTGAWTDEVGTAFASAEGPAVTCNGCSCGSPMGVACGATSVKLYTEDACSGSSDLTVLLMPDCAPVPGVAPLSIEADAVSASGGSCSPAGGGVAQKAPVMLGGEVALCHPGTGTGCQSGQTCAPVLGETDKPCIYRDGDYRCEAPYLKTLLYRAYDDSRGCTDCACDWPTGTSCTGTIEVFASNDCTGTVLAGAATDAVCTPGSPSSANSVGYSASEDFSGFCNASGADPTGAVTASQPVTLCCTP